MSSTPLPRLVVTGASGFVGRRLLEHLAPHYRIFAVARRSQAECGAPRHANISWHQVDIGHLRPVAALFRAIRDGGGARHLVHLAAHYDFTGDEDPEYLRTNVGGLRNVLELSRDLGLSRFVFASSIAACRFPKAGGVVTEDSAPDGVHIYARTKRRGEEMLAEYRDAFASVIVRFAALYSDWCEYPPLYVFLDTWLSRRWDARILGGRGDSAVPYLHVRDAADFLRVLLQHEGDLAPCEVLLASPDGAVSHRELYGAATACGQERPRPAIRVPKGLAWAGMWMRDGLGRALGSRPFARPWMAHYIDRVLRVDGRRTRQRLSWAPRPRLAVVGRIPFLIENLKSDPVEWFRRNQEAMKLVHLRANLRIHALLEEHEDEISGAWTRFLTDGGPRGGPRCRDLPHDDHRGHPRLALRNLAHSVRTREKGVFMGYCRDLAERRFEQGFAAAEVCAALESLDRICLEALRSDPEAAGLDEVLHHLVTMTIRFGIDQVLETFELLAGGRGDAPTSRVEDHLWSFHKGGWTG